MGGTTIIDVKVVGLCSKCRKPGDEILKDKTGRIYEDKEISCVGCTLKVEKYYVWICKNCGKQLSEEIMGQKCPYCKKWTYTLDCKKEVKLNEQFQRGPSVFIKRAALCTKKGIRAICGTDEEYSEYVKKLMEVHNR